MKVSFDEPAEPPRFASGLREIADAYDVIFCDVWGVVHDGRAAFGDACRALEIFRQRGGTVILLTNAPRPQKPILAQLARLGAPTSAFDALVTSGDVTLSYLVERGNAPVHHIGPERDLALFEALSEQAGLSPPLVSLSDATYVLCTGLGDDETETPEDYREALAQMRARNMDFICANPDLVVHVGDRLVYCAGALAASYEQIGGRVLQAGKPHAPIYARARAQAQASRGGPVSSDRILAIGDALRTDIRGAAAAGIASLFITSGIHREELHSVMTMQIDRAAFEQFLDGAGCRPTAVAAHLKW
jgi:HAD superfamily hydrolase (TIGR01459 family)